MAIDLAQVKMAELRTAIKGLNESGLLTEKIKMVGKAAELAQKFVEGLEECNKAGTLDDVPDTVFEYYNRIVPPKETPAGTAPAPAGAAPAATGRSTRGTTTTPAQAPKGRKATRASVFAKIVKRGKFTRDQLTERLNKEFRENSKENRWWVGNYLNLLTELGIAEIDDKGRANYLGA